MPDTPQPPAVPAHPDHFGFEVTHRLETPGHDGAPLGRTGVITTPVSYTHLTLPTIYSV